MFYEDSFPDPDDTAPARRLAQPLPLPIVQRVRAAFLKEMVVLLSRDAVAAEERALLEALWPLADALHELLDPQKGAR
jgi:hypothetical protein